MRFVAYFCIFVICLLLLLIVARAGGHALGAQPAPGRSQVGKSESLNPGGLIHSQLFFEHNIFFQKQECDKLIPRSRQDHTCVHEIPNILLHYIYEKCRIYHNTNYISKSVAVEPNIIWQCYTHSIHKLYTLRLWECGSDLGINLILRQTKFLVAAEMAISNNRPYNCCMYNKCCNEINY